MKIPSRERLFSSCLSVSLRYKPFNSQREPWCALAVNSPSLNSERVTFDKINWATHPNRLHTIQINITYLILAWNLFSLAAILNFAVGWSEGWKQ